MALEREPFVLGDCPFHSLYYKLWKGQTFLPPEPFPFFENPRYFTHPLIGQKCQKCQNPIKYPVLSSKFLAKLSLKHNPIKNMCWYYLPNWKYSGPWLSSNLLSSPIWSYLVSPVGHQGWHCTRLTAGRHRTGRTAGRHRPRSTAGRHRTMFKERMPVRNLLSGHMTSQWAGS